MDKLAGMQAFVETVDRGSLTAAAQSLGRSLPTVVRSLAQLEETLGVRLLQRTTRSRSLTREGRVYLEHCRRILADVAEAEVALSNEAVEPQGEVRLTAPVLFGTWHVAPIVNAFLLRYPRVQVDLRLSDGVVDLVDHAIDIAVRIGSLPDSSMVAIPVARLRRVLCASPALLDRVGRPDHPDALETLPTIQFNPLTLGDGWRFYEDGQERLWHFPSAFACDQALVAAEAARSGLGCVLLLSYQAEPFVRAGELEVVLEAYEPPARPVQLVHAGHRLMSARVRSLLDHLRDALRERQPGALA